MWEIFCKCFSLFYHDNYSVFLDFVFLHGEELECERECSRGEDYRLIKLTITDFNVGAVCL
jgi:hypothetical protein